LNTDLILFHLTDCVDVLNDLKTAIVEDEFDENTLFDLMTHAYHHLNSAWNSRACESWDESVERYSEFERFPTAFQSELGMEEPAHMKEGDIMIGED